MDSLNETDCGDGPALAGRTGRSTLYARATDEWPPTTMVRSGAAHPERQGRGTGAPTGEYDDVVTSICSGESPQTPYNQSTDTKVQFGTELIGLNQHMAMCVALRR